MKLARVGFLDDFAFDFDVPDFNIDVPDFDFDIPDFNPEDFDILDLDTADFDLPEFDLPSFTLPSFDFNMDTIFKTAGLGMSIFGQVAQHDLAQSSIDAQRAQIEARNSVLVPGDNSGTVYPTGTVYTPGGGSTIPGFLSNLSGNTPLILSVAAAVAVAAFAFGDDKPQRKRKG